MSVNPWIKFLSNAGISRGSPHGIKQKDPQHGGKREEKDRPRSDDASMERKWYMGSCREGSVLMTNRMVQFPRTAMKYMRQIGIEIQM